MFKNGNVIFFHFDQFLDIPAAVSYPHFYRSDPSLLDAVEGLQPDAEKHSSEIVLQPVSEDQVINCADFQQIYHLLYTAIGRANESALAHTTQYTVRQNKIQYSSETIRQHCFAYCVVGNIR